jgi:cobyrinic acid a,c-diamide synthase
MLLDLPVLLVVNCQSMSHSVAAMVHGYCTLQPQLRIAGLLLNRVGSDRHLEILETALASLPVPILGVFRREDAISLPDRHLGLVPTNELPELRSIVDRLATLGEQCFRWQQLMPLLQVKPQVVPTAQPIAPQVKIGVARDAAFSFYYAENLEILQSLGAELVPWSPLQDEVLPPVQGLYFGGGFPEMFAAQLADNVAMRRAVRAAIQAQIPTYAECGGLMYLTESIADFQGHSYPMVGVLPTQAQMGKKLTLGYRTAIAQAATPLLVPGEIVRGHEFHRSSLTVAASQPLFQLQHRVFPSAGSGIDRTEGWHQPHLHASYLHLHWGTNRHLPQRFLQQALQSMNRLPHNPVKMVDLP